MNCDIIRPYSFNLAGKDLISDDFSFSSANRVASSYMTVINLLSAKYYPDSDRFVIYLLEPQNTTKYNSSFYRINFYPTEFKMEQVPADSHFLLSFERNVRGLAVMLHSFYSIRTV
jgi:hypothetical protein